MSTARLSLVILVGVLSACDRPTSDVKRSSDEKEVSAHLAADMRGTWAAEPRLCGRAVWRITSGAIYSDSGVTCALRSPRPGADGWTANATCADRPGGLLELNPSSGPPAGLVVSGAPFPAPVTLVRCKGADAPAPDPHALLERAHVIDLSIASKAEGVTARNDPHNAAVRRAWWKNGDLIKVVEPSVPTGGSPSRIFYFQPGSESPFLVRTPKRQFGFSDGRLLEIFSNEGERLAELQRPGFEEEARHLLREAKVARSLASSLRDRAGSGGRGDGSAND